jgi:hypothetical protein
MVRSHGNAKFRSFIGIISQIQSIKEQLESIKAGGGTNILNGLEQASVILKKSGSGKRLIKKPKKCLIFSSQQIFLFSDGQDSNQYQITRFCSNTYESTQITTSSFGIGSDFDEKLMLQIASLGGGFCK